MRTNFLSILLLLDPVLGRSPYLFHRGLSISIRARDGTPPGLNSRCATSISSTLGGGSGPSNPSNEGSTSTLEVGTDNAATEDMQERSNEKSSRGESLESSENSTNEIMQSVDPKPLPSNSSNFSETENASVDTHATGLNSDNDSIEREASAAVSSLPVEISNETQQLTKKEIRRKKKEVVRSHKLYAKKLKNRNNLNLSRKLLHAGFGLFFATLNLKLPRSKFIPGMTILTSLTLTMEMLRYRKSFGWMNDVLHFVLGSSLRKHEMEGKFTGSFYYFLGVTITSALFTPTCASLGICQLALADPSASFFGRQTRHVYWSRIENGFFGLGRNKGFLGFLGGALFCFPFNYRVLSVARFGATGIPGGKQSVAIASIALGLAGAFADLCVPTPALTMPKKILGVPMPNFHVDDNVVVPIISGYACTKIFTKLGWSHTVNLAKFIIY
uniref:Phosphatidate cytidylyltransferase n=1 Tax=Eucampia antarctica TaxID=49252 RepID=A0A7S2RCX4_9STRA|mmetsp:Transcript_20532/g.19775  ORF Transcript_20532/g.19775 Transcript_20532/m.19775 type:complete len:444 (+) Transcript_20532:174-1505(+)|eukprot:CAMPEP_0197836512 /NCGR_PEP_ID=MMETSP1437-20131217/29254_1 /TAXON_ID=49252 ORGANISM="Eucampia antarctica, Strain CCMP1452" /NCGR_SAMPLE_ID=MMETSP1437 /ASSEMBLY_ACC=CAM_ASM_001096 /LENGTH=443 /DNA_ID=CAMNT_0043442759 /DNA_START=172 /DNA_END=1503 /DNA_ORIENTATION=-